MISKPVSSKFLDLKNKIFAASQKLFAPVSENSCIIAHIDNFILFFIALTLIVSVFAESEIIGAFAFAVILLTCAKLFLQKGAKIEIFIWDAALIIYFLITLISTINSELFSQSLHGFLKTAIYIFYYFTAANYFQTNRNKFKYILLVMGSLCLVESVIAVWQNFNGIEQIATWQDSNYINPEDAISRAYGTLKPLNPNLLGGYLLAGMPCIIAAGMICLFKGNCRTFASNIVSFLLCILAVFLTGSRGAYLGIIAVIAGFVIIFSKLLSDEFEGVARVKKYWKGFILGLAGLIAVVLACVPQIVKRLFSIFILRGDSSTSFRMNVYNSSWHMFLDNWSLGIGAGNQTFREIYGLYMVTGFDALSSYSVPLEIAVEAGVFALAAYVIFIGLFLYNAVRFIYGKDESGNPSEKIIVCCTILTILGVMTHGLFDTIYFRPQIQFVFWTMIAMSSSVFYGKITGNDK
jgi:putative inorganic carbon (HCO3(-)) transporter